MLHVQHRKGPFDSVAKLYSRIRDGAPECILNMPSSELSPGG